MEVIKDIRLEVKDAEFGRGVFARKDIRKGSLIHVAPVIVIEKEETHHMFDSVMGNYCFLWGKNNDKLALALGFGSLFNHSYYPNVVYSDNEDEGVILYHATKDIKQGEELFISYNGNHDDISPLPYEWFDINTLISDLDYIKQNNLYIMPSSLERFDDSVTKLEHVKLSLSNYHDLKVEGEVE